MAIEKTIAPFFPKEKYNEVYIQLERAFRQSKDHKPDLIKWSIEILRHIKKQNKKTAAITSRSRDEVVWLFTHYKDLNTLFDYHISRDDVSALKPSPEGIIKTLDHFWIWIKDAVFIWDSHHDYWAAKAIWMKFCWVCSWVLNAGDWEEIWASYLESTDELISSF